MVYQAKYSCSDCGHIFSVITDHRPRGRCPSCPECKNNNYSTLKSTTKSNKIYSQDEIDKNRKEIIDSRKAPGFLDPSAKSKAFDMAAEITMQDHGMTDINMGNNLRPGDNCVPKLAAHLEQQVDNVFKTQKNNISGTPATNNLNKTLINQINSGAFKNYGGAGDVVARQQKDQYKIPTNIIGEYRPTNKLN